MKKLSQDDVVYSAHGLVIRKTTDFYVAINPNLPNLIVVDEEGHDFLELCDGTNSLDAIAKKLNQMHPTGSTEEVIHKFANSLVQSGFISTEPQFLPKKRSEPLNKLNQLYIHLTQACNLRCKHCYINAGVKLPNELNEEENVNLLEEFAQLGGESLVITGGEPLTVKDLLQQVIITARKLGIKQISLETNGVLLTEDDALFFKKNDVAVGVSLGGATSQTHSYIRGEGTFENILNNIGQLVAKGVHTRIGLTFTRHNLHEAREIVFLAKQLGVSSVTFNMIVMAGRAEYSQDLRMQTDEILPVVRKVREASREAGTTTIFEDILSGVKTFGRRDSCGAGVRSLSITSDGDVYPCNSFIDSAMKAGNIRQHSLEDVWRNSPIIHEFQDMSVLDVEGCRDCETKFICAGGCLAETFRAFGSIKKQTPYCSMYKQIYSEMISELATELWRQT